MGSLQLLVNWLERFASALEVYYNAAVRLQSLGDLARLRSEREEKERELERKREILDEAEVSEKEEKQLLSAVTEARVNVTKQQFKMIAPLVTNIYNRLDPHPTFTDISFQHERYYGKGRSYALVSDQAVGLQVDPLAVFSSSQANAAALSCFLGMGWRVGGRQLPFVMLDDPLQAMDDINVLGFADLCRFLRKRKQLIISTHDRRFAGLLRRKLTPRDTTDRIVVHEFIGWHQSGPTVDTTFPSYETDKNRALKLVTINS